MKTEFEVGDLVTFDPFGSERFIGLVTKIWTSFAGEYWVTVLWNDGDETDEEANIKKSFLTLWSEYDERG